MVRLETDAKFDHACSRLFDAAPLETLTAVSNINQLIVDHLVREHPQAAREGRIDYDVLRALWKQHERLDPVD